MPSYTTSLRLIQPSTGEYPGDWGNQVNSSLTAVVDKAVAGTATITMTAANYTLTNANGVADEAKSMFLVLQGTPGASYFVIVPTASKLYFVTNNTGFAQSVSTSASGGVSVPNGASMVLRCDGTNVVEALNSLGSIVLNGGTANGVAYLNGSKVVTTGSALVFDGTNFSTTGTASATKLIPTGGSATGNGMYLPAANTLAWSTNGAETMRLDSSGNLGLGVTPSAAIAGTTIEVGVNKSGAFGALGSGPVDNAYVSANAYPTGSADPAFTSWKYTRTGFAAKYEAGRGGAHQWFTAPSGTAGNAITFTQAMTLDADGELGIGTTSPSAGLDVRKQETSTYNTARFSNGTDVQFLDVVCGRALTNGTVGGVSSSLVMTLRSSGSSSGHLAFATGNDERARVTQGGDFLVGTSTVVGVGGITLQSITSGFAIVNNNDAGATGYVFSSYRRSSTEIGSITQNGTTAVLFNTTSDRRLKDNIVPAPSASAVIDAIEIVSHDWKAAPDEHVTYGVIAQDLALVAPQAVLQGDDGDDIEKTWGVDYSKLVPMLIKEIQSLRARVAALEQA